MSRKRLILKKSMSNTTINQIETNNLKKIPSTYQTKKTLDAFFKYNNCLYIIQFVTADTHSIKGCLESFSFSSYADSPPSNEWKFVFIMDGSRTLKVSVLQEKIFPV